jgi:hypothetical protein
MPYKNKEDQKRVSRIHYEKNKSDYIKRASENNKKTIEKCKKLVLEYLLKHPCVDCGECDPIVLEFDHTEGNKFGNIADIVGKALGLRRLKEEIAKCEVRCANCHRRITHKRRL